jgi:2-polyprenyl-3-methyl-5-hydroxy-6-metoxy-1,4-benzoquinol methylase
MGFSRHERADTAEWMDATGVDRAALCGNLRDLRRLNAWLGWRASVVEQVARIVASDGLKRFRLLDVATGSGDIPEAVLEWATRHGYPASIVATDVHPVTLSFAAERSGSPAIQLARHDASHCPFASQSFDIATCNLALHHFSPVNAVQVLRELGRVARHVVVSDLVRSRPAYLAALGLAQLFRNPLTAHDGPLSVCRAYTITEARTLACDAGLIPSVRPLFPFRMLLHAPGERIGPWTT